jgi:hypothetical protein
LVPKKKQRKDQTERALDKLIIDWNSSDKTICIWFFSFIGSEPQQTLHADITAPFLKTGFSMDEWTGGI